MKLRFTISTLLLVAAIVAAYLAGRIPLLQRTRTAERRAVEAQSELESFMLHSEIAIGGYSYSLDPIRSNVEDAPFWIDKSVAPPLSVTDAFVICSTIIKTLESESSRTKIKRWHLDSLSLLPLDSLSPEDRDPQRWLYSAQFLGWEDNSPGSTSFSAVIIMDGTVFIGDNNFEPEIDEVVRQLFPSL